MVSVKRNESAMVQSDLELTKHVETDEQTKAEQRKEIETDGT